MISPDNVLTCINVGDSRSILIQCLNERTAGETWVSNPLSRDHKPDLLDER